MYRDRLAPHATESAMVPTRASPASEAESLFVMRRFAVLYRPRRRTRLGDGSFRTGLEVQDLGTSRTAIPRAPMERLQVRAATHELRLGARVAQAIEAQSRERPMGLQMDADEALGAITRDARADIRRLFDTKGELLPVHQWSDDIARSVKSVRQKPWGALIRSRVLPWQHEPAGPGMPSADRASTVRRTPPHT